MNEHDALIYKECLERVLHVVRTFLPPDGPWTPSEAMSEIIQIVDPWPLSSPEPRYVPPPPVD